MMSENKSGYGFVHFSDDHEGLLSTLKAIEVFSTPTVIDNVEYCCEASQKLLKKLSVPSLPHLINDGSDNSRLRTASAHTDGSFDSSQNDFRSTYRKSSASFHDDCYSNISHGMSETRKVAKSTSFSSDSLPSTYYDSGTDISPKISYRESDPYSGTQSTKSVVYGNEGNSMYHNQKYVNYPEYPISMRNYSNSSGHDFINPVGMNTNPLPNLLNQLQIGGSKPSSLTKTESVRVDESYNEILKPGGKSSDSSKDDNHPFSRFR
jgi:hypothetical protein